MKTEFHRAIEIYRNQGLSKLSKATKNYLETRYVKSYQDNRVDNNIRWEFIYSNLDEEDNHLIDIGCASGVLTAKAAKSGIQAVGYEAYTSRFKKAKQSYSDLSNIKFVNKELTPTNIKSIPETDVILFLTVHHHWEDAYGVENSNDMFKHLMSKSDKLFYEPPGILKCMSGQGELNPENSIDYYTGVLNSEYPDIIIEDQILVERKEGKRRDPIFYINTSNVK